jgi:type II secretory ATPase GspE/PulE/Tfp pilus assembly ATPase PilB-like protein
MSNEDLGVNNKMTEDGDQNSFSNVSILNVGRKELDFDIEQALASVILDDEAPFTIEDDIAHGSDRGKGVTNFLSKYSIEKSITLSTFMDFYAVNYSFAQEFINKAGDLSLENSTNTFYVVGQLIQDNDAVFSGYPRNIIVTTAKSKDHHMPFFNGLKMRIENSTGGAGCEIYHATVTDLLNMIEAMIEVFNDRNRTQVEEADSKEETKAKKKFREIVVEALHLGATDIHIIPKSNVAQIKYTISGVIVDGPPIEKGLANRMIVASLLTSSPEYGAMASDSELADARIVDKYDVEREMNTPSGRKEVRIVKEQVTLRVGKSPSNYGPHTTMRVLRETEGKQINLNELGHDPDNLELLKRFLKKPNGILLMTGPTGSGKTTTLAGCYEEIDHNKKIIVLEDPIEIKLIHPNVVQSAVQPENPDKDYNSFLKKALRQAPHVIGISEVRDHNVALYCFRAALTGHLMISTIHTNGSIETIVRLNDLGIDYNLMAVEGLLDTIAAQRLLRTLCPHCKVEYNDPNPLLGKIFKANDQGCSHCKEGYKGRVIISEVFVFDSKIRELVTKPNNTTLIRNYLKSKGWRSMADRALEKVKSGLCDPNEALSHIPGFLDVSDEVNYSNLVSGLL